MKNKKNKRKKNKRKKKSFVKNFKSYFMEKPNISNKNMI